MPKLTEPEVVERNLRQSYDDAYYKSREALIRYSLGEPPDYNWHGSVALSGELPDDTDMLIRWDDPGISKRMLSNQALMIAKVCYMDPDPSYPDKGEWAELITKAFNRALWRGRPYKGPGIASSWEWAPEIHRAFSDGDGLGVGFVQIGVRDGWVTIRHHPLTRVIWDRYRFGINRTRFICFVHSMSVEEAVDMFGSKIEAEAGPAQTVTTSDGPMRVIRLFQWFDMGMGKSEPTEMWRLRSMGGKVLSRDPNVFECLPFVHYEHVHFWGMKRPAGRLELQMADNQMRNRYERYLRLCLERGPGFDVFGSGFDAEDMERLKSGELLPMLQAKLPPMSKVADVVQRYPPHEPPSGLFKGLDYLDRMDPGNSGLSEADRANITRSPRTLGELQLVQGGADTQKMWSLRQYAAMQSRLWYKVNWIAAKLHVAPTPLTIKGIPILFNDPVEPRSAIAHWLTPASYPVVNEDRLQWQSPLEKAQIAQGKWLPFLNDPFMNPVEVRQALLGQEGYGEKDPDRFLNPQAAALSQGTAGGGLADALGMQLDQQASQGDIPPI